MATAVAGFQPARYRNVEFGAEGLEHAGQAHGGEDAQVSH